MSEYDVANQRETVTISVERYNALVEIENTSKQMKESAQRERRRIQGELESLYSLEFMEGNKTMYVQIDKLNLLGLLQLNFQKEENIKHVIFEFHDRGIFHDERSRKW